MHENIGASDNSALIEELIYYYIEKKRLTTKNYNYVSSIKWDKYFAEAAELCVKHAQPAQVYVQKLYDRMENKRAFFSPEHLRGGNVDKFFDILKTSPEDTYTVEITNDNLDYAEVWRHQHELAMRYIRRGESTESVLIDSSLKFFAWYRILSTPKAHPEIIAKYKHIARKEINPRLREFIAQEGLPLERILS
jgi:hypothetical protein